MVALKSFFSMQVVATNTDLTDLILLIILLKIGAVSRKVVQVGKMAR